MATEIEKKSPEECPPRMGPYFGGEFAYDIGSHYIVTDYSQPQSHIKRSDECVLRYFAQNNSKIAANKYPNRTSINCGGCQRTVTLTTIEKPNNNDNAPKSNEAIQSETQPSPLDQSQPV